MKNRDLKQPLRLKVELEVHTTNLPVFRRVLAKSKHFIVGQSWRVLRARLKVMDRTDRRKP